MPGVGGRLLYNARVNDDAPNGQRLIFESALRATNPIQDFLIEVDLNVVVAVSVVGVGSPIPTALEEEPEPDLIQHLFLPWVSR